MGTPKVLKLTPNTRVLSDDAQALGGLVVEALFVADHVFVLDRRQQPNLVQRVLLFLL